MNNPKPSRLVGAWLIAASALLAGCAASAAGDVAPAPRTSPTPKAPAAPVAIARGEGRFMQLNLAGWEKVYAQVDYGTAASCSKTLDTFVAGASNPGAVYATTNCSSTDAAPRLPVKATLQDATIGQAVSVATDTMATCRMAVDGVKDDVLPDTKQLRFTVVVDCKASS